MTERFSKEWIAERREAGKTAGLVLMSDYRRCLDEIERLQSLVSAYENDLVLLDVTEKLKKAEIIIEDKQQIINRLAKKIIVASQDMIAQSNDITVDEYIEYLRLKNNQEEE